MPCRPSCRDAVSILLVFILFVGQARSTICLLLVTPDAVVIGTDSKTVTITSNSPVLIGQDEKVVSIAQGRVIVGTEGLANITHHGSRGTREIYNFPTWARALPVKAGTPIMQVANVFARESFKIMNEEISQEMRDGTSSPPNNDPSLPLVVYFIGECAATGCSAVTVTIMIDWKKRVVNRPEIRMEFPKKVPTAWTASWSSVKTGVLDRFLTGDSSTRRRYQHDYPSEIDPLLRGFALTPEEALNASKLLLSLAINERPDLYSFPMVVYSLSAHQPAKRYEYKQ